jgi:hypothetical protein
VLGQGQPLFDFPRGIVVTKNSDDDRVEPSSAPAPIRNDNLLDDDSMGQLHDIEIAAAHLLLNGAQGRSVARVSGIDSGSKTKSQKRTKKDEVLSTVVQIGKENVLQKVKVDVSRGWL